MTRVRLLTKFETFDRAKVGLKNVPSVKSRVRVQRSGD